MTPALYQSNYSFVVGHGPGKCGAVGCVVCSCTMILRDLGIADLTPEEFNAAALKAGAFSDDVLNSGVALRALGADAEEKHYSGLPYERARIMSTGGRMLVRVAFDDKSPNGHHTIAAMKIDQTGALACLCPAIGPMTLDPDMRAEVKWGDKPKTYRVVNLRGVFKR